MKVFTFICDNKVTAHGLVLKRIILCFSCDILYKKKPFFPPKERKKLWGKEELELLNVNVNVNVRI